MSKSKSQQVKKMMCSACKYSEKYCDVHGVACHTAMEAGYHPPMEKELHNKKLAREKRK